MHEPSANVNVSRVEANGARVLALGSLLAERRQTQCANCGKFKLRGYWIDFNPRAELPVTLGLCPRCERRPEAA